MHLHTKKYIDNLFKNAIYEVSLIQLTAEDIQNYKLGLIKKNSNTLKGDGLTLKEDSGTHNYIKLTEDDKVSKDVQMTKADKTYKNNDSSIDNEPPNKKQKLETNGIDVLKLVLSRESETHKFESQVKFSLKSNKEIASTSTEEVPMEIDSEKTTESAKSSDKNVKSRIWVMSPRKMMDEGRYKSWTETLAVYKSSTTEPKSSLRNNKVNGVKHTLNGKSNVRGNLIEIEKLYIKYFSKSVQDTIVIIANILNIISMSSKYHENRINKSCKKISKAKKLQEICDADQLHERHKTILETKLKNNFIGVISSFAESEFDSAFQMFFLSILTVLRVLDQPKFRKGSIFKNLVHLLWNSLKNSEFNHQFKQKIFSMFRSNTFQPDCIDLISIIEDSRDIDPGVTYRMALFFVSTVNSREYFQPVIDAVTSDSNEDLELLIDNANFQCCINSMYKNLVDSSPAVHSNNKIPVPETIQGPINSDVTIQNWFLANSPDGTYHSLVQVTSSSSETTTSTPPTKSFMMFNPSIQNKKSVANSQLRTAIGSIIEIGNKPYQLVQGPLGQMKAVVNGTNMVSMVQSPSTVIIKCFAKKCNSSVTIMCSGCATVKYCSHECQRRDWYDNHKDVCKPLETGA